MLDKTVASFEQALEGLKDGDTVLVAGFGGSGVPANLLAALLRHGARDLTVVNNNAGNGSPGLLELIAAGRVAKIVCSYARASPPVDPNHAAFVEAWRSGRLELECVPQGTMTERMRAAGAGLGPFFTPTGYGTRLGEGKETRVIDGKGYVLETPLPGDFAFVRAHKADRWGNLVYRNADRCFGPTMCMAGKVAVVEVDEVVPLGALAPEDIHTSGIFVQRVILGR